MAGSGEKWRWADPKGIQRLVHADEMRAALASGALPPYTLVWRRGMVDWQPAYEIAELATGAVGQQGAVANIPPPPLAIVAVQAEFEHRADERDDVSSAEAPPPPIHRYAAIAAAVPAEVTRALQQSQAAATRAASMKRERRVAASPVAVSEPEDDDHETWVAKPALVDSARAAAAPAKSQPDPSPPISAARATEPAHAPGSRNGAALSVQPPLPPPPGSMRSGPPPPPPRRSYAAPPIRHAPGSAAPPSLLPPVPLPGGAGPSTVGSASADSPDSLAAAEPSQSARGPARKGGRLGFGRNGEVPSSREGLPSFPLDDSDDDDARVSRSDESAGPSLGARLRQLLGRIHLDRLTQTLAYVRAHPREPKVMIGVGATGLIVLIVVVLAAAATGKEKANPIETSQAAAKATGAGERDPNQETMPQPHKAVAVARGQKPTPALACRLSSGARRLAPKAWKDVPLELAMGPGDRVRLGMATEVDSALGLSLPLDSLEPTTELSLRAPGKLSSVVPAAGDARAFVISAEGASDKLRAGRPISTNPPLIIGWADGAVGVATSATEIVHPLWPMDGDEVPDAFRAVDAGDAGFAVVFRRRGAIYTGWVGRDQHARAPLVQVTGAGSPPGSPVGTPSLGTNGESITVAFADRSSAARPWGVWMGTAPIGSLPKQTAAFEIPPGGPGGAAFAPAVAGLPDGRWLLVWTEGAGGNHDVRAQTLAPDLRPLGAPFTVSDAPGNAGQGAVAVSDGQGLLAFLSLTDHGYEVWGARVDCR